MNEPQVLECSWIPAREMMGRGRVAELADCSDALAQLAFAARNTSTSMRAAQAMPKVAFAAQEIKKRENG